MKDGAAGENMIVSSPAAYTADELKGVMVFENPDGTSCRMRVYRPMAPCNEFSHYAQQSERLPAGLLKETLQFLDKGRRGFALTLEGAEQGHVLQGARVFLVGD